MFFYVTDYTGNYIYKNGTLEFFNHAEGYVEKEADGYKYVYQFKDHLGNIRLSYKDADKNGSISTSEIVQEKNYYPFGLQHEGYNFAVNGSKHNYGYNGKEEQDELGLEWLDFGARNYDPALGRWMNTDPLAESFISITPYNAMVNNPLSYIDPDGRFSTNVTKNEDGTHTVVEGGDANDGDNNIYVVDGDGNRTGDVIGESLTSHSFFDENDSAVVGAVIDTNSSEGQDFIDNEIIADDPGLVDYMVNATGGEKFDLKDRGIEKAVEGGQTPIQHRYRGSKASNGKIGSARDFGNGAAGIVAARKGLSWSMTRVGFDGLETFQNRSASWLVAPYAIGEGTPSVLAQKLGFQIGKALNASEGIRLPSNRTVQRFGEY